MIARFEINKYISSQHYNSSNKKKAFGEVSNSEDKLASVYSIAYNQAPLSFQRQREGFKEIFPNNAVFADSFGGSEFYTILENLH